MKRPLIFLGLLWAMPPGPALMNHLLNAFEASSQYERHRTALIADNELTESDLERLSLEQLLEIRLQAQLVTIWREVPEKAIECWTHAPGIT